MKTYDSIRWGVIGAGDVVDYKSGEPLYSTPGSKLVAVMRRDGEKAADFARRHKIPRWYTSVDKLLADPEINAIYVASPHGFHAEHSIAAAKAGKIVLCEKPMGTSTAEAQSIVDACRTANVPLAVAYYRRCWPDVQRMRSLIAEGAIGPITHARVQLSGYFAGDPQRPWLTDRKLSGGGALSNGGSHWIDLVRYLIGEPTEVYGCVSSAASGFEVEDTAGVLMRLHDNVPVQYISTWTGTGVGDFDIMGMDGRLLASPLSSGYITLHRRDREPEKIDVKREGPSHKEFIEELVRGLREGSPLPATGEDAVAAWRIMDGAYSSSATGQPVRLTKA